MDNSSLTTISGAGSAFAQDICCAKHTINGTKFYARQLNIEGSHGSSVYLTNNGGEVWALGYKTERASPIWETKSGGKSEVLGGLFYPLQAVGSSIAAFTNTESQHSLVIASDPYNSGYATYVKETRGGVTATLPASSLPARGPGRFVPLHTGYPSVLYPLGTPTGSPRSAAGGGFDVIVDNADAAGVTITGTWTASTFTPGYYGADYLHDGNTGQGTKSVRFTPNLPAAGSVTVYGRWTTDPNRATNVPIDITHAGGTTTATVNMELNNGTWVALGTFNFNAGTGGNVLIRTTGANGYVIADAVRFQQQGGNTAPTISDIADQTINEDGATSALNFTVDDAETAAGSLTVSGSSSNTTLVPNGNIVFGGSGASRTVTVTPAANQNGTATITVTVSDGSLTANDTFLLTVNAVNDVPSFTKGANQTVNAGAGAQSVANWATALSAGPANESGQALNFIVSNSNNAIFSVQPTISATGALTYTPVSSVAAATTATVTVQIHDDGGSANGGGDTSAAQTFTITVNPVSFDVIMDNTDATGVTITGTWTAATATAGYYGTNYLHDGNTGKGTKSVRFTPNLPAANGVTVYARWTAFGNRATNVPIDITHAGGTTTVTVNQTLNNGVWVLLGTFNFNAGTGGNVLIRTTGTSNYVIADAVRFQK